MKILIKHGWLVDPAHDINDARDIVVENGKIACVQKGLSIADAHVLDATGKIVLPGLVDMHVHLREPGREDKETIATGTRAAVRAGVTTVLAMPNTTPPIDDVAMVRQVQEAIKNHGAVTVYISATLTKGRLGREVSDIACLAEAGVVAFSDDGESIDNEDVMVAALRAAREKNALVICHCEDSRLSAGGVVHLGFTSTRMGLRGISSESEYRRVERDIRLAALTGARIHIAHVSCKESVALIRAAKTRGVCISAETAPHYFALNEEAVWGYDSNKKMNPPLRSPEDVENIREGLRDGTIDVIASDHAPHTLNEKDIEFDRAAFGVIGLETEVSVAITELVEKGVLDWPALVKKMALHPARILGIEKGTLGVGKDADVTIVAPEEEWVVKKEGFASKSKNSAFLGRRLKGVVAATIRSGEIAYMHDESFAHQRAREIS